MISPLLTRLIELTQQGYRIEFKAGHTLGPSLVVDVWQKANGVMFQNTFTLTSECLRDAAIGGDELFYLKMEESVQDIEKAKANVASTREWANG